MISKTFQLTRTLPSGLVKANPTPFATLRLACVAAGMSLHDNAGTPKAEAQRFGVRLSNVPLGTTLDHDASGYSFRVDCVEAA